MAGSRWRRCCGRAGPARTTPRTTSRCSTSPSPSCPNQSEKGCWYGPTAAAETKAFTGHVTALDLQYSVGIGTAVGVDRELLDRLPPAAWTDAYDSDSEPRDGAQVAELSGLLPELTTRGWPAGLWVIARWARPHPGAQLRLTDADGWRITLFATNTPLGQLADLELRHRLRARCEDRIRCLKDTGARNLPIHDFAQNQIWLETTLLAADLLAWTATLELSAHRRAEPRRLRLRLLNVAARVVRTGRRIILRLPRSWPWAGEIAAAHAPVMSPARPRLPTPTHPVQDLENRRHPKAVTNAGMRLPEASNRKITKNRG